ncbi:nucleotidyltransferase [Halorhodospira neutriphila]|uniref:Nucleotidyltransferase n=1 Tax=Halorhodospira neutriphila TaxID=168379 RepID=A0ABS1E4Q0_9GAMM|nr:nucleotidyltransferase [Halorhodospira neutriphila]MBK1726723.1 hypothetical protein [Halorhodospira neutriphila]
MPRTVNAAFSDFLKNNVNLDANVSASARSSRDWLWSQLHAFPNKHESFPLSYSEKDIQFGSFARKTKIRELDDIDILYCMKSQDAKYYDYSNDHVKIEVARNSRFWPMRFDGSSLLNSRLVVNCIVKHLRDIPQYAKSDISRNNAAAVLDLTSYAWSFDIVPGFFTAPESDGRNYYIIPNGKGHWQKTDPRMDRDRVKRLNRAHNGNLLNVIRLVKYWNRRQTMPTASSYLLETLVLDYYDVAPKIASQWPDLEFREVLSHIPTMIRKPIWDSKKIEGDINTLDVNERDRVASRAEADLSTASEAWYAEKQGNHAKAISKWQRVFGPAFPGYG